MGDIIEITAGVVLFPELFRQRLGGFGKSFHSYRRNKPPQANAQIMGFDQLPSVMDQISLEVTLARLMKEFDSGP